MAFLRKRDVAERPPTPTPAPAPPPPARAHADVERDPRSLTDRPVVRSGIYAWAVLGLVGVAFCVGVAVSRLSIVVIPLILALFPAALLKAPTDWLKGRGLKPSLAALAVLLGFLLLMSGIIGALAPAVAAQFSDISTAVQAGVEDLDAFLRRGPFGMSPVRLDELVERGRQQLSESEGLRQGLFGAALAVAEGLAGVVFGLVALFFYLKDGERLAGAVRDVFPRRMRDDAEQIGVRAWQSLGDYIRGQIIIALVDAVLIGAAILILGVPLFLPLFVIVFLGGLFPIVGAVTAGAIAVLVALAANGLLDAAILLAWIFVVQQIEGDVLAPVVLGKATKLHPLMTLAALTAGAVLLGVLGAFLAIPVAASLAHAISYLRERTPG